MATVVANSDVTRAALLRESAHTNMMKRFLSAFLVLAAVSSALGKPEKQAVKKEKRVPQTLSRDECPHSQGKNRVPQSTAAINHAKKVFASNKEIQKLADEDFILLNLVVRVNVNHPSLTVRADITGRYANRLYAYEPTDTSLLIANMKKAKKLLKTEL
ncbi:hypothetical protein JZ751_004295 [Albula glossodonta]|uniref:Uncharacterized protein n=1 Tax=Albula glossodonta TaxID=121402 RepID=A0A8T2N6N0_9TELE|nr:hypothetical protein JZ751_004295 [Albula glossodonta]